MSKIPIVLTLFYLLVFSLENFFPYFKNRGNRSHHTVNNLVIAAMNGLLNFLFLFTIIGLMANWANEKEIGLLNQIYISSNVRLFFAFILLDVWMYIWHMMNHRIKIFWRLHRAHHNDIMMDSTTSLRFHPIEITLSQVSNIGLVIIFGFRLQELLIYNLILQMIIFFHHSNIGIPEKWDKIFRVLIVMPNMHRVHHSIVVSETNSNYSSIFSFWDRIFRTFRKRNDTKTITIGLPYWRENSWQDLNGFIRLPFLLQVDNTQGL